MKKETNPIDITIYLLFWKVRFWIVISVLLIL